MSVTFWRRRVGRSVNGHLYFTVEGEPCVYQCDVDEPCRRCKKPLGDEKPAVLITVTASPPRRPSAQDHIHWMFMTKGRQATYKKYRVGLYHEQCIPPAVFHAAAGSRPAPGRSRAVSADVRASLPRAARADVSGNTVRERGTLTTGAERP